MKVIGRQANWENVMRVKSADKLSVSTKQNDKKKSVFFSREVRKKKEKILQCRQCNKCSYVQ